jgi:acyl carrier protein
MLDEDKSIKMIIEALNDLIDEDTEDEKKLTILNANSDTRLFGSNGILDSMDVVILLSDLEERLDEEYDVAISLANDSIMSKARSPFRTVKSLSKYVLDAVSN